ncbi:MAG: hypothetical protein KF889_07330 [Alphaproteobacteria bacterium]|nr:hypothetical protein [Alphaproteobacteria bacterium]MCW5740632.1 hypothetical protein [Alphaproteobacteria bacterium]
MTRLSRRERDRAAQVLRLRHDARRARMHAASVTDAEDLQLYRQLADEWDREADVLENAGADDRPARR